MLRRTFGILILTILVAAPSAHAAFRCVPARVSMACPVANVYPSVQAAIDASAAGDYIYIGANNQPERFTVTKRLYIQGLAGHLITDPPAQPAGLDRPAQPLIAIGAGVNGATLSKLTLDVVTGAGGIYVPPTAGPVGLNQLVVTSTAEARPPYGIRIDGATRAAVTHSRVSGFQIGVDFVAATWHKLEPVVIENNDVGVRIIHGKGQVFWNTFRNNGVALEVRGTVQHNLNSNDFIDNDVGLLWGLAATAHPQTNAVESRLTEFDHNDFDTDDGGVAFQIETIPGAFSSSFTDDPGCSTRWVNNRVNRTVLPAFKTSSSC